MSLDYLLAMKTENETISAYLKEIHNNYNSMKEETIYHLIETSINVNMNTTQYNKHISEINDLLNLQNDHIKQFLLLNEKIKQKLMILCKHDWVKDTIDIHPEKSINIEYCKICQITK